MEDKNQKIQGLLKALLQMDESEHNETQKEFLKKISDHKINLSVFNSQLENKSLYNGLTEYSDLASIDIDPVDWGITLPKNSPPGLLYQNVTIDLGKDWNIKGMSIDLGKGYKK